MKRLALALALAAGPALARLPPPRVPPTIPAYSTIFPDSYEFVYPTGEPTPLYGPADLAAATPTRRIPRAEFEGQLEPRALLALRTLRRALAEHATSRRRAALFAHLPRALHARAPAPSAAPVPPTIWVVSFALKSDDLRRSWLPLSIAPATPQDLDRLAAVRVPGRPLDRATLLPPDHPTSAAVAFLAPHLRALQEAWEPSAELAYPRVETYVDRHGRADEARIRALFEDPVESPSDRAQLGSWRYRDAAGNLLFDGRRVDTDDGPRDAADRAAIARLRARLTAAPADVIAYEALPATRIGSETLVYHQLLAEDPGGVRALGGGVSLTSGGRVLPTLLVPGSYPAPPLSFSVPRATLAWACRLAGRLDPDRYMQLIGQLDGEEPADPALAGASVRFVDRTTRLPGTQLAQVADYLEAYHRRLGFSPRRQRCIYKGRAFDNVIVDIPGRTDEWVLLADHYDAAVNEDTFAGGAMTAAPAANDNLTATAALLEAARILSPLHRGGHALGGAWPPKRGLRLVHFVGEEYPADCLGARVYAQHALASGERLHALVLMDMIGFAGPGGRLHDPVFQLNLGEHPRSAQLAGAALQSFAQLRARGLVPRAMRPEIRRRYDERSYLYNTDGVIFSDVGFPVLFVNEHINQGHNLTRRGYHDSADVRANICRPYATALARLSFATALLLAAD